MIKDSKCSRASAEHDEAGIIAFGRSGGGAQLSSLFSSLLLLVWFAVLLHCCDDERAGLPAYCVRNSEMPLEWQCYHT